MGVLRCVLFVVKLVLKILLWILKSDESTTKDGERPKIVLPVKDSSTSGVTDDSPSSSSSGIGSSISSQDISLLDDRVFEDELKRELEIRKLHRENQDLRERLNLQYRKLVAAQKQKQDDTRGKWMTSSRRHRFCSFPEKLDVESSSPSLCARRLSVADASAVRTLSKPELGFQKSVDHMIRDKLTRELNREREENKRLQKYIDDIMLIVLENNPKLLEK